MITKLATVLRGAVLAATLFLGVAAPSLAQQVGVFNNVPVNVVSLEQFGGGKSVADNSTAFASAMTALGGGGGIVQLQCGVYPFAHGITLLSYVTVTGCGGNNTTLNFASDVTVEPAIALGQFYSQLQHLNVANSNGIGITSNLSVTSQALTLVDVAVSTTRNAGACLHLNNVLLSTFRDVKLSACASHGVLADGAENTSLNFINVYATGTSGDGFHITNTVYTAIVAAASGSNTGYGFFFENVTGLTVTGSGGESNPAGCFYADASTAIGVGATVPDVNSLTLEGNFCTSNGSTGATPASLLETHATNSKPVNVLLNNDFDFTTNGASLVMSGAGVTVTNTASTLKGTSNPTSSAVYAGAPSVAFTPGLSFGGAAVGLTYTTQTGTYAKYNNIVVVNINLKINVIGSSTGIARVTGLPFPFSGAPASPVAYYTGMSGVTGQLGLICNNGGGSTTCDFVIGAATGVASATNTNFAATSNVIFTLVYVTS